MFRWCALLLLGATALPAAELRMTARALERALAAQAFNGPQGRRYLSGSERTPCDYAYLEQPRLQARDGKVRLTVHLRARRGLALLKGCLGVPVSPQVTITGDPFLDGEALGLRNVAVERLDGSLESLPVIRQLLLSFVRRQLPAEFRYAFRSELDRALGQLSQAQGLTARFARFRTDHVQAAGDAVTLTGDFTLLIDVQ